MIRTSRVLIFGSLLSLLIAVGSFAGGWMASRAAGNVSLGTYLGTMVNRGAEGGTPTDVRDQFTVFWDVWSLVQQEFYHREPLDQQRMVYGAIKGMLQSLNDEYTTFQEPDLAAASRESMQGKFEGIGAYLRVQNGEIAIDRPIKGSPAEKAGLKSGDVIVKVDGVELAPLVKGLSDADASAKAVSKIRGEKGTTVVLTLRRPPETTTFDMSIVRDEVPLISVNAQMLEGGVAYIQITEFKAPTTSELDAALRELLPQQPRSIVLDLRNNSGGFLQSAQEVLGRFYEGTALIEENSNGELKELNTIAAPEDVRAFTIPMVVLQNGGTASAGEIVAGALRDMRPNTVLMGEKSFGKGSVQNIHQLRDGSSARITIAQWFTPNRSEIHKVGITPQYVVPASAEAQYAVPCVVDKRPAEGQSACTDSQLAWGLRYLTQQATPPPVPTPTG
ncbi:MAG: S41 family peptidase [Chloroflexaceae bacterium]|jgi:carboxyl-terminal processing protease|nr:S41 family peptidase [Chloroflexaceae bacterium]